MILSKKIAGAQQPPKLAREPTGSILLLHNILYKSLCRRYYIRVYIYIYIELTVHIHIYIYILYNIFEIVLRTGLFERLAEYGWKPLRHRFAKAYLSRASIYWYTRETTEGRGFIELEISSSTISTVFRQPLRQVLLGVLSGAAAASGKTRTVQFM